MRICLVSREYPPETAHGGIGSQAYLKAVGLTARGHDVRVISASVDEQRHEYDDGGVRVTRIPGLEDRLPIYRDVVDWVGYSTEVAVELSRLHDAVALDLVEFPEWGGEGFMWLLNRSESNHVPAIVQLHGPLVLFAHAIGWPEIDSELYRVGTAMESAVLRLADFVYSSSRCSAEYCERFHGLDASAIPVEHTGVDVNVFRPAGGKEDRPTIVFVGRLTADKGVYDLLDAVQLLTDRFPGLRLRLIGAGDVDDVNAHARTLGIADNVESLGFVSHGALPAQLSRADVFAAPSRYEPGPGLVNLEAMACGLPVIACSGSGAAEVVEHGENGLLVPPGDPAALAAALASVLEDGQMRERLGMRARRFAEEEMSSEACLDRIERIYTAVARPATPVTA